MGHRKIIFLSLLAFAAPLSWGETGAELIARISAPCEPAAIKMAGNMIRERKPIQAVRVDFPIRALSRGIRGEVILGFELSEEGRPVNPVVVCDKPPGIFRRAAFEAATMLDFSNAPINQGDQAAYRFTFDPKDADLLVNYACEFDKEKKKFSRPKTLEKPIILNAVVNSSQEVRAELPENSQSPFVGSYKRQGKGVTVVSLTVDDENWLATVEDGSLQREASVEVKSLKGRTKIRLLGACRTTAAFDQRTRQ